VDNVDEEGATRGSEETPRSNPATREESEVLKTFVFSLNDEEPFWVDEDLFPI
jgi:hypothetical protein